MDVIKVFYKLGTTGMDVRKHSIHQIAGVVEVNGEIKEEFNILSRPHPKSLYDKDALEACKKTQEELLSYPDMIIALGQLKAIY